MKKFWFFLSSFRHIKMKLFLPVYEKFTGEYQKCILFAFSVKTNWNKLFCESLWFSSPHLDFHWKFFALNNFFSGAACQNCLLRGQTNFLRNNSLLQNRVLNHFQNSVEIFQNFNEVSPVGLSKLNYTSPGEKFEEKFSFLKKMLFCQSRTMKEKLSPFFLHFFSTQLSKLHSKCPKEHLKGIDFFRKKNVFFFISLGDWNKLFNVLSILLLQAYQICALCVPANNLREKVFWEICVLSICKIERKILDIPCKKIRWVVKATFYVSSRTFSGKM